MKRYLAWGLSALAAVLLCGSVLLVLLTYTRPMSGEVYSFYLGWESEAMPDDWVYDQKGWTVFTQKEDSVTELTADGLGSFTGLDHPGQTFYFSRVLTEQVSSPTLQVGLADRCVVVFLDGEVLYTDAPEQDNRVGYLELPMMGWYREPMVLTLPQDYVGKTLTIAQSTSEFSEIPGMEAAATPASVSLYCSYAHESALIAESFRIAIPASVCLILAVLGFGSFLWLGFRRRWDIGLAVFAVMLLAYASAILCRTSFFSRYFGSMDVDLNALLRAAALTALLILLGQRGGKLRWLLWGCSAVHGICALPGWSSATSSFTTISEWAGLLGLLAAAVLAVVWLRERKLFFRVFTPIYLALLLGLAAWNLLYSPLREAIPVQLAATLNHGLCRYFLWPISIPAIFASAVAAAVEVYIHENQRRTETRMLLQRGEIAQENYETLRRHNEEMSSLRHDMRHHITALQGMCREGDLERASAYLIELGGRPELAVRGGYTVHPAVDAVLTAILERGAKLGIRTDVQVELPPQLPIPDSDLCALLMNLLENALEANEKAPEGADKWIEVAAHIRGEYLYIGVKNSRFTPVELDPEEQLFRSTKGTALHGYGLKSARALAQKYHSELRLKAPEGCFSASTALLLPER